MRPNTPTHYRALAQKRGFRWLGPEVPNVSTRTGWECPKGHQWRTTYQEIKRGSNCPVCAGRAPKTAADYHALAKERGFRWLGPDLPPTIRTKTTWECGRGHRWQAVYGNIWGSRTGCPHCANDARRRKPADYHALAEKRGFRWLGPVVRFVAAQTTWECDQGHQWETSYSSIRGGTLCPVCRRNRRKSVKS